MNTLIENMQLIGLIIGLSVTGIPFIIKIISTTKKFIKEKNWTCILRELPQLIERAEKFSNYNSVEKKEWVLSQLRTFCVDNKITFDLDKFEQEITNIIELTKKVNQREKDKKGNVI